MEFVNNLWNLEQKGDRVMTAGLVFILQWKLLSCLFLNHEWLSCEWGVGEGREHLEVKIKDKIDYKIMC